MIECLVLSEYPNWIFTLSENAMNIGILFGCCGVLSEIERNENIRNCLKTNLKIASNMFILGSLLNIYRINKF